MKKQISLLFFLLLWLPGALAFSESEEQETIMSRDFGKTVLEDGTAEKNYTYAEDTIFHDVVEVATGIQYLAVLKSDGTVSLAKINYSIESGSYEEYYVDFNNKEYRIPVDMDVLQSEVSGWRDIKSIEVFQFADSGWYDNCEILVGLDNSGKLHVAGGFSPETRDYYLEYIGPCIRTEDWSDVVSISTCFRLLIGVRSDGSLYFAGDSDGAEGIEYLAENASNVAFVKMASSSQGPGAVCLFRDGRLGAARYNIEKEEFSIEYDAEEVQAFDVGQSITAALHTDNTVSFWGNRVPNCFDVEQVCCVGWDAYVVKQNGDVFLVTIGYPNEFEVHETDLKDIKRIYTNHSGNRIYGILGLKNDGSVVSKWNENATQINLSNWTDIADIYFPAEHIVYVAGLKHDGSLIVSGNVTVEVY